ncbi:hypothetical protein KY289_034553 [Solanum tuberosum]|nr:hypothetical protein KY289_034553 [Solanum tuberosum]
MVPIWVQQPLPKAVEYNVQEQFEDLAAQQLDLRSVTDERYQEVRLNMDCRKVEMMRFVQSLKDSIDGIRLHQQAKERGATSSSIEPPSIVGHGILGPNLFHAVNQRLRLVAMNLEDEALAWHQSYLWCRDPPNVIGWDEYLREVFRLARLTEPTQLANPRSQIRPSGLQGGVVTKQHQEILVARSQPINYNQGTRLTLPSSSGGKPRRTISLAKYRQKGLRMESIELEYLELELESPVNDNTYGKGAQTNHVKGYSDCVERFGCTVFPTPTSYVSLEKNVKETTTGVVKDFGWMLQGITYQSNLIVFPIGQYDIVLGALWMKTLGPVTMLVSSKAVNKLSGDELLKEETIAPEIGVLLVQYHKILSEHKILPHPRGPFDHKIPLQNGTKPVNIRPYKYSAMKKDIIEKLVNNMLQQGVIQYSNNPFSSPVVVVVKKNGTWRLCVDYRELNQCTIKDKFPIPIIDDLLDEMA